LTRPASIARNFFFAGGAIGVVTEVCCGMSIAACRHFEKTKPKEVAVHRPLKLLGHVIVLLMALAIVYAAYISVTYWTGIGV
jgi:hypothetical protein